MKFLCTHCDALAELTSFRTDGESLVVTCAKCGSENRAERVSRAGGDACHAERARAQTPRPSVALVSSPQASNVVSLRTTSTDAVEHAARQALEVDPFEVPPGFCPKCLSPLASAPSRAGLSANACAQCGLMFDQADPSHFQCPVWLADAWRSLLVSWGDEPRHERLRKEARLRDDLIALARLYRLRLAHLPDDPFAVRGREAVLHLAATSVSASKTREVTEQTSGHPTLVWGVAICSALLALAALAYTLVRGWSPQGP
jgi:hypothetical protein